MPSSHRLAVGHGRAQDARAEILLSWHRSRTSGVDPDRLEIGRAEVETHSPFVRIGAPVLASMADLLTGSSSTSLALADTAGTVMWRWESDSRIGSELDRSEFEPGSRFAEQEAGTNGIGVALASRRPATVVGAEHYKQDWHKWACVASPVVHPITLRVCGAVNVACRAQDANSLLQVAARALVNELRSAFYDASAPRQRRLLNASLTFRTATTRPVVALDDRIMIIDDAAAAFRLDRATLWALVGEAGPSATQIQIDDDLKAHIYPVTAGDLSHGVVLALQAVDPSAARSVLNNVAASTATRRSQAVLKPLEQAEADVICSFLAECGGNKSETAERLGISRGTLYERIRRYRINDH